MVMFSTSQILKQTFRPCANLLSFLLFLKALERYFCNGMESIQRFQLSVATCILLIQNIKSKFSNVKDVYFSVAII